MIAMRRVRLHWWIFLGIALGAAIGTWLNLSHYAEFEHTVNIPVVLLLVEQLLQVVGQVSFLQNNKITMTGQPFKIFLPFFIASFMAVPVQHSETPGIQLINLLRNCRVIGR